VFLIDAIIIIVGLIVFEVVSSVDNAIVNANILKTMGVTWRKRFLTVGVIISVFLVRFLLPLLIFYISVPNLTLGGVLGNFTGANTAAAEAIEVQKPIVLMFGAIFLLYLYMHWLFLEKKEPLFIERYLKKEHGVWFFGFAAIILVVVMFFARNNSMMMLAVAIGSATFFILYGLQETAGVKQASGTQMSDISKFVYLEVLDATFSFDGVVGSFAFTTNLLLIFIGIGIGAIVVRQLTVKGIDKVAKYKYLKNGAMTSIGLLGLFMAIEAFGIELPLYAPIAVTLLFVGLAFWKSREHLKKQPVGKTNVQ